MPPYYCCSPYYPCPYHWQQEQAMSQGYYNNFFGPRPNEYNSPFQDVRPAMPPPARPPMPPTAQPTVDPPVQPPMPPPVHHLITALMHARMFWNYTSQQLDSMRYNVQGNEQNLKRKPEETQQIQKAKAARKEVDDIISTMVGLDEVKMQLEQWFKGLVLDQQRKNLGLKLGTRKALHMAFLGNPGTGKTMLARYLGKVLHKLGLISTDKVVEVQRTDLVGEYVGQTGIKTRMKIKEARGGILFVDEAYKLVPHDINEFGVEALEEIMTAMDDKDIVVIFAGYSKEMERVIAANHGFARRVTNFFYFADYSSTDIALILHSKFVNPKNDSYIFGFKLHPNCTVDAVAKLIKEHTTEEQMKKMNGGLVDPLLVKALDNLNFRLNEDCSDLDALMTITMEDLEEGLESLTSNEKEIVVPAMYI